MLRATDRIDASEAASRPQRDTLLLDHFERRNPSGKVTGLRGNIIELDLPRGVALTHDDWLSVDDGGVIEIVSRPEPLIEVRSADASALARAAWLLGDHHIAAELSERRLRVLRDPVIAPLLAALDVRLLHIEAPFEPEPGAYAHGN